MILDFKVLDPGSEIRVEKKYWICDPDPVKNDPDLNHWKSRNFLPGNYR